MRSPRIRKTNKVSFALAFARSQQSLAFCRDCFLVHLDEQLGNVVAEFGQYEDGLDGSLAIVHALHFADQRV